MPIFIKYGNIKGQSTDRNHHLWADVEYIRWPDVERKISSPSSTQMDRESSNAVIKNISIVRKQDNASPYFFIEACCGDGKEVQLALTKTGQGLGDDTFMLYTIRNALISKYTTLATTQTGARPIERIDIAFADCEMRYVTYDEDGVSQAPIAVGFNSMTNTKI